jgi:hypothetical protein
MRREQYGRRKKTVCYEWWMRTNSANIIIKFISGMTLSKTYFYLLVEKEIILFIK